MFKNQNILLFFAVAIALVMTSCEEEYDKSSLIDGFEDKLVVFSYFSVDEPWSVSVRTNGNLIDHQNNVEDVQNAIVEIYNEQGEFLYELFYDVDGYYNRAGYYPSQGQNYTIKVSARGYPTVVARSYIPIKSSLHIEDFSAVVENNEEGVEVRFRIENDAQKEAYYMWEIKKIDQDESNNIDLGDGDLINTLFKDINEGNDINSDASPDLVGNEVFDQGTFETDYNSLDNNLVVLDPIDQETEGIFGSSSEIDTKIIPNVNILDYEVLNESHQIGGEGNEEEGGTSTESYTYELRVLAISKELYHYYNSLSDYHRQNGPSNNSMRISPEIYSNVDNGLGIFAGYSESVLQF